MIDQIKPIELYRGGVVESSHDLHIAVVDKFGNTLYHYGNPNRMTFSRSTLKPFQAIPLIESGAANEFFFNKMDLALCCASHSGEERHRKRVLSMLDRINMDDSYLKCGPQIPRDQKGYQKWIKEGKEVTSVFNNCSGKHAGMLATCLKRNEDTESYNKMSHPLQQEIVDIIFNICKLQEKYFSSGIDGCGLPTHRFPLDKLALGFAHLARPDFMEDQTHLVALEQIKESMMGHPEMIGGLDRFDTDIMNAMPGNIVSKMGAEGIQCIGLIESGIGIAVKIEDGSNRASSVAAMEVLKQIGFGNESFYHIMEEYRKPKILNTVGIQVGEIIAEFTLK